MVKCAARTCYNNTANKPYRNFFRFPCNKPLADIWAKNAGRENLITRSVKSMSEFFLCEEHFEEKFFNKTSEQHVKLNYKALPIPTIFKNNLHVVLNMNEDRDKIFGSDAEFGQISYTETMFASSWKVPESGHGTQQGFCRLCTKQLPITDIIPVNAYHRQMLDACFPGQHKYFPRKICFSCIDKLKTYCNSLIVCDRYKTYVKNADALSSRESLVAENNLQLEIKYQCLQCNVLFNDEKEVTDHYFLSHPSGKRKIYRIVKVRALKRKNEAENEETIVETCQKPEDNQMKKVVMIKILEKNTDTSNETVVDINKPHYKIIYEQPDKIKILLDNKECPSMRYECLLCHSTHHRTKQALMKHNRVYHPDNIDGKIYCRILKPKQFRQEDIKCLVCPNTFTSIEKYRQHMKKHVSFKCDECEATFEFIYKLYRHKKQHLEDKEACQIEDKKEEQNIEKEEECEIKDKGEERKIEDEKEECNIENKQQCEIEDKEERKIEDEKEFILEDENEESNIEFEEEYQIEDEKEDCRIEDQEECTIEDEKEEFNNEFEEECEIEYLQEEYNNKFKECKLEDDKEDKTKEYNFKDENLEETTDSNPFLCEICGKMFRKYQYLTKHNLTHLNINTHQCETCQKRFKSKTRYRLHKEKHFSQGSKNYSCHCGKLFCLKADLKQHSLTHKPKNHVCNICGKKFRGQQPLIAHRKKHFPNLEKCTICGQEFDCKVGLKNHMYEHRKELFGCNICCKTYVDNRQLQIHLRCHTGERPYTCEYCGKGFRSWKTAAIHKYIHLNIYKYQCDICNKKFRQSGSLTDHKRTHSKERPFGCAICAQTFSLRSNMIKHQKAHEKIAKPPKKHKKPAKDKSFSCPDCGKTFRYKINLTKHQKTHEVDEIAEDNFMDFDLYDENIISDDYLNFLNANSEENISFQTMLIGDL